MKKVKLCSFILILLFFSIKVYSNSIFNIAYLITANEEKASNLVEVKVNREELYFEEHSENIKDQYLDEKNEIKVVGNLDLQNYGTSFFYFKKNIYGLFYPESVDFFIQKNENEEPIKLEKESNNFMQTKPILLDGGKKYKIVAIGKNLKNTVNLKEEYFSLEAFKNNESLGEVKNRLIIENNLLVKPNKDNKEVQYLDFNGKVETILDIEFKNPLKEKIRLKLDYNYIYIKEVEGILNNQIIKFYWNEKDQCFYSDEILIEGEVTLDIAGIGVKTTNGFKDGLFTVSALVEGITHGKVTNKVILESKNKILLEKKSEQKQVRVGDLLKYTLYISVTNEDNFKKFIFKDFLPRGFDLKEDSIKVSKGSVKNIKKEIENQFSFEIEFGQREFQEVFLTISYIVRVGAMAKHGKNTNRAIIYGDNFVNPILESNMASAVVDVDSENFSEKGIILGMVYLDLDKDNEYDITKDLPIPGVKVILENGDFAITDENGKYSIYGEDATTHIGKIDKKSLIYGLEGVKLSVKHSKNGESQFIDLKKAQLYSANFAFILKNKDEEKEVVKKILKRKEVLEEQTKEYIYNVESKELSFKGASSIKEKKELGAEGTINNFKVVEFEKEENFKEKKKDILEKIELTDKVIENVNVLSEEEITNSMEKMNNSLDIINISNGDIVPHIMTFQIKAPLGGRIEFYINGNNISASNIGLRASSELNSLFFLEYSSIKLEKGKNIVKVSYLDPFGIERDSIQKEILVRGDLSEIRFEKMSENEDDGIESFLIKGTDDNGIEIPYILNVSIEEFGGGEWVSEDEKKDTKGLQTTIRPNKQTIVKFKPKAGKRKIRFKVRIEDIEKEFEFELSGKTEEMFVNGIIEGRINLKGKNSENFFFEKKINNLHNDKFYYRGAAFAQGHIKDKYYLTMTYDSAKEDEKFFSYKDSDDYYPIYGDNSIKGYIGESREDLYIKVEQEESYIMYGDYKTSELFDDRLRLNQYSRTLTGFSSEIDENKVEVNTFVAKTSSEKVVEEFQGRGLSGPYTLSNRNILEGSEEVRLVIYSKTTGGVLSETSLVRGRDYTIDYSLGKLYFSEPIMGYDLNFNPIFIKVNYEMENDTGKKHKIYGGNAEYKVKDNLIVGGSYIKDENPEDEYEMNGVYFLYDDKTTLLVLEKSETIESEQGIGSASSIYYKYEKDSLEIKAKYEKSDRNYYNPDSKVSQGVERVDIEAKYEFENQNILKLESELLKDELEEGGYEKKDVYLGLEFAKKWDFIYELGVKHYSKNESFENDVNTVGAKVIWVPEKYNFIKGFLEYEQDILLSDKRRAAAGVDYDINKNTVIYLRHEFISNLGNEYFLDPEDDSNRILAGIKSKGYLGTEVFSEYREKNEDNGIFPEIGYGIKKDLEITEKLTLSGTFERIDPVIKKNKGKDHSSDDEEDDRRSSTSVTLGVDYEIDNVSRIKGDVEIEFGNEESFLNKLGYGRKLTENIYFIGKNRYFIEGDTEEENRLILGLAYRDSENNRYSSLNKYELNYSKNIIDENYKQITNILRSSHNYKFNKNLDGTLTLGLKNVNTTYEEIISNYTAYLIAGTVSYNIYKNWTTGINISTIFDSDGNINYGLGGEVGYVFESNLWLSVGYNIVGFKDRDFDPAGELNQGVYVRFRVNIGDLLDRGK